MLTNSFLQHVKEFTILDSIAKTGPGKVDVSGMGKTKGGRGQCADKGDLQLFRSGIRSRLLRRGLKGELGIFMACVPDRDFGNAAAYVFIKDAAVAYRGVPLVGPKQHHGFVDLSQKCGHILTDTRGIELDAARGRSTFSQRNSYRGAAKRVPDKNNLVDVDAAIDNFRLAVNESDHSCQGPAVTNPWTVFG